ncbi:ASKHA domain-containing protein [Rhizobiaceae bacterium]|nr:ASKHA domain-containing protein [Rhizobiaceae bacterium]
MTNPLVVFTPSGKRGRFPVGTPILDAARELGVYVESVCGGRGICGRCQVEPMVGAFAKLQIESTADSISDWSSKEARYTDKRGSLKQGRRLSCSSTVQGPLVVDIPADAAVHQQTIRKAADQRVIHRDPAIKLCYVEVEEPDMHKPLGDLDRLKAALHAGWGYDDILVSQHILPQVQKTLRAGKWTATAAVHLDMESSRPTLVALYPGLKNEAYGIACDIGSTTIAMHLSSLLSGITLASAGTSNPQIRFGEDLMSRVSYVMMNPDGGREALTKSVREAVNDLLRQVCAEAEVDQMDVLDMVFVGNPIMHHLFLGIDPTELGGAPFALAVSGAVHTWASELEIDASEGARVYMLPCIAGHVGADAAGATLSEGPDKGEVMALLVDVGTNAEIVLGNRHRTLACSSPTGPAFEGAEISCGQRAAPGAIERVRIDPVTLEPRIRVIGSEKWSDEAGFAEDLADIGVTGICGSGIIEVMAEMFLAGITDEDGVIDAGGPARSERVFLNGRTHAYRLWHAEGHPEIIVTQTDVRAIQLAKAALYAGVRLLMDKQGVTQVDTISLAGAFGTFIDPKYALVLGLVPDCTIADVKAVGNAAGTGARMALLNRAHRREIEETVTRIEKIETALEPKFQEHFVNAMAFPNKVELFPRLEAEVTLPTRREVAAAGEPPKRRGGRRRG